MPDPQAPVIGVHLASLNLFREPDGTLEITVAGGSNAVLQEIDAARFGGPPIDYIEGLICDAADRMGARRSPPIDPAARLGLDDPEGRN